jgi:hypothetical protein
MRPTLECMGNRYALVALLLVGCALDEVDTSTVEQDLLASNRLASNRLASNRLASNRLASNSLGAAALTAGSLIETVEGRDVFSYIVACALPTGKSISVTDSRGTAYTFAGEIGLAPGWQTTTPTVTDRRWVTACVLARTNYYGVTVQLSMRGSHSALATTTTELRNFPAAEGAFYGDLFDTTAQTWFACGTKAWTSVLSQDEERACTLSPDGVTTMCGFTYTYFCGTAYDQTHLPACGSKPPWTKCKGGATTYNEVISIYLPY